MGSGDPVGQAARTTLAAARLFAGHEAGAVITEREGMLLIASEVPATSLFHSAARRVARELDAGAAVDAVRAFAAEHEREMLLWVSEDDDSDLVAAAEAAGLSRGSDLAGMLIDAAPALPKVPSGVELVPVDSGESASAYADVHRRLYAAATRAAFAAGARRVVLQATKLGEPVYRKIGYRQFTTYVRYPTG